MADEIKLTQRSVEALAIPEKGRVYYRDTVLPGFACCVTETGSRTFYRLGRIEGRPTFYKIGKFPGVTVEHARDICKATNGRIALGENPANDRRTARREHTLGSLFDWWLDTHAKLNLKSWDEDERRFKQFFTQSRSRRLSSFSKSELQELHAKIGRDNGRTTANRVISLLSAIFNKADGIGYRGTNPTRGIQKYAEQSRDRFLTPEEVPAFFASLKVETQLFQDFFLMALLTGARRDNLQSMRWADVRIDSANWRIPDTKAGVPVDLHLPAKAVEILRRRKDNAAPGNPWVFASRGKTGHLTEPKTAWKRIIDRAGLSDIRVHDLRRTLGSWQAIGGSSLTVIGKSLGHTSLASTEVYARLTNTPVVDSVNMATSAILAAAEPVKAKPKRKAATNGKK